MPFQFSEHHIEEYRTQGFTVFRSILPPSLIDDLRRVCDRGRILAREMQGAQTQRFQPITAFDIDHKPFEDYRDLPPLRDAISRVLSPNHVHGDLSVMGVLLEPADEPWCTHWHRDWRDNIKGLDLDRFEASYQDMDLFNQINCALYEDSCTWVVPGSHLRRDTPEEAARFPERPIVPPDIHGQSPATRERTCLEYCQSMPGAERLYLNSGDFALYRSVLWHIGNYVPYRRRATLHDAPMTVRFHEWRNEALPEAQRRIQAGIEWENPNRREVVGV